MEGGKVNINILDIVLFASAALIFQAGWMIDFSLTKKVYVPFLFKTYQISGEVWFFIAYSYLIIGGVILELTITNLFFIPFYLVYIALVNFISYNRDSFLRRRVTLTVYGQRWNILFYSAVLVLVVGLFVSGAF